MTDTADKDSTLPATATGEQPPVDQDEASQSDTSHDDEPSMPLTLQFHGKPLTLTIPSSLTIDELSTHISTLLNIPPSHQKFLISPKPGLLKPPFPSTPITSILTPKTKITLLGTTTAEISALNTTISSNRLRELRGGTNTAKPSRHRDWRKTQDEITYTFHDIRPLPYLPDPARSARFLERLRDDPGIKAAMRKHKFTVPLLTEMNPAEHTTRESRTLGLNRNRGEVIELRLRTDAYDGYRDYKVIRKTLCHELAHCVFGEHDRDFWDLTGQIEREVERGDWKSGGRSVGSEEFYNPEDEGVEHGDVDGGGWTGGEFVLGGGKESAGSEGLSRREVLARAAMERIEREKRAKNPNSGGGQETEKGSEPSGS
ncbi:MAG: hypothetical protein Q9160_007171 [Pyrenula sp. 1 TL-2023]